MAPGKVWRGGLQQRGERGTLAPLLSSEGQNIPKNEPYWETVVEAFHRGVLMSPGKIISGDTATLSHRGDGMRGTKRTLDTTGPRPLICAGLYLSVYIA